MEENKVRDAIKTIKSNYPTSGYYMLCEALDMAIEALEKQLPKKPKQSGLTTQDGVFHRINGIDGVPYDLCPNCEVNLCTGGILGRSKKNMKYCERCGQKLNWTET